MDNDSGDRRLGVTEPVDGERRSALLAMAKGLAYVPPVVATFAMGGMSARAATAYVTNLS
ncbi:MAG: hypothetical protein ACLP8B_27135 [Xanthobacteraceae bacterium]